MLPPKSPATVPFAAAKREPAQQAGKAALSQADNLAAHLSRHVVDDAFRETAPSIAARYLDDLLAAGTRLADFTQSASRIPGNQWKNFDQLRAYLLRQTHFSDEDVGLIANGDSILDALGSGKNALFIVRNGRPYIVLRSGATNGEVLHELGHMLTHKHLGNNAYWALDKSIREHLASTFVRSRRSFWKMTPDEIWQELKAIDPTFVPNDTIRNLLRQWGALIE
ncbi:MAG: hypothetical protein GYA36_20375 [Veillonellaceae bacterium]|nr:hypothetical protein [Veillonellaceae bacterium]